MGSRPTSPAWLTGGAAWAIVVALTLIGLVPRLIHFDGSLLGDELSTLYIVDGRSLPDVFSLISSDAEISPPLYFVLGWLFTQLGSAPELVRLPSLIASVAVVPLTYMVGARALSRPAGVIAAAAMALNPFMVFYSTDGRAYMVAIALLLGTTLTMLIAIESERRRWWVAYGVLTALCMYAHYTTAFVLGAQLLWLLWAHHDRWKPALIANVAAAITFVPWLPSMRDDFDSPTIDLLSGLQGDGFDVKRDAVEAWAFGYPFNRPEDVPGRLAITIGSIALLIAAIAGLWRWAVPRLRGRGELRVSRGMVLVIALALATPVAELVLLGLGGSDLFGARNLLTASPGFMLTIGALGSAAGPIAGTVCIAALLGVFAYGTARSFDPEVETIQFKEAADFVDASAGGDDVVVDMISPVISPVPLTGLDAYLPQDREEFRLYRTETPPPFLKYPPAPKPILEEAIRAAEGGRLYLVTGDEVISEDDGRLTVTLPPADPERDDEETLTFPPSWKVVDRGEWEGISNVVVLVIEDGEGPVG